MKIERVPVASIIKAVDADALFAEYFDECGNKSLSAGPKPDLDRYVLLENAGVFVSLVAKEGEEVVGFVGLLVSDVLHFSAKTAVVESIFLTKSHRKGANGIRLLRAAIKQAKELGAVGVYASAPVGSSFDRLCSLLRAKHMNNMYYVG